MANKILIIGVGSAGVIAADKMNVPNSKKLYVDSSNQILNELKSEGEKICLFSPYCNCLDMPIMKYPSSLWIHLIWKDICLMAISI